MMPEIDNKDNSFAVRSFRGVLPYPNQFILLKKPLFSAINATFTY
jgi:hypothetical protein